jgi:mono/diheme cytochrome c family protein
MPFCGFGSDASFGISNALPSGETNLSLCGSVTKFMSKRQLTRSLAIAILLGATANIGFGQSVDRSAASTYKTKCVSCHGQDGRGSATGKSLNVADFHSAQVQQQSDAQLAGVIAEGRGNMPPFGTRLSKDQIDTLVKYIRTLGKAK